MDDIVGVILAGGQSKRMKGCNKALSKLGNSTLLDIAIRNVKKIN